MLLIVLETVLQISAAVRQISAALLPVLHNGELRVHGCLNCAMSSHSSCSGLLSITAG